MTTGTGTTATRAQAQEILEQLAGPAATLRDDQWTAIEALVAQGLTMDQAIERIAYPDNPEKWAVPAEEPAAIAAE